MVSSCNPEENLKPSATDENLTEIELMEKSGINLFKTELTVTDEPGENKILLRIASRSEEVLNNYLKIYQFSISPVKGKLYNKRESSPYATDEPGDKGYNDIDMSAVITEVAREHLRPDVTGFILNAKVVDKAFANGRSMANGYPNRAYHESGNWPETFKIFGYQTIRYEFDGKSRWYSGWSSRTFCEYYDPSDCRGFWEQPSENWINVDGPYRVRAVVDFFNYTDYSQCFNCI